MNLFYLMFSPAGRKRDLAKIKVVETFEEEPWTTLDRMDALLNDLLPRYRAKHGRGCYFFVQAAERSNK